MSAAEDRARDPALDQAVSAIHDRYGATLLGVLLYGSYRRGVRDAMPDFYALLADYSALPRWQRVAARLLPPNVYHLRFGAEALRAKLTVVRLDRFEAGTGTDFQSYFWARFAQPCLLLYARDDEARGRIASALEAAAGSFAARVVPLLGARFGVRELWTTGLKLTYGCELRSEGTGRAEALFAADSEHFERVTAALADARPAILRAVGGGGYAHDTAAPARRRARIGWSLRRLQGKLLSAARVIKAALTFEDPLDYLLWKIQRHSGVRETPTERQRRWPLIFAWPLLWRVYRRGGFK